MLDILQ